ncbi:MAG: CRISPR-associated endoribonuclease Cas6 [Candidatus Pacearchaeota archaeon]
MRIILEFLSLKDCSYELKYHKKIQGFVYNLLKETPYEAIHDKKGYKFFCFSNIIPPKEMKENDKRVLIISSPDVQMIHYLKEKIFALKEKNKEINIGEMFFRIQKVKVLKTRIRKRCSLITGTPIIIRIPKKKYKEYGIKSVYPYVYWRSKWPFRAFVKQIEDNIIRKYANFYKLKKEDIENMKKKVLPLFQQFILKKEICNHVLIEGKEVKFFGSLWEFIFDNLNKEQRKILEFGLDAGFGEKNSMGFGFINLKENYDKYG